VLFTTADTEHTEDAQRKYSITLCHLCIHQRRIGTSGAFFIENKFQQTGSFIYRLYEAALGRQPNNYRGMVCAFITSSEYQHRFGTIVTRTNRDCSN
jgi:hypothetical protein